jgi:hypothetical protein
MSAVLLWLALVSAAVAVADDTDQVPLLVTGENTIRRAHQSLRCNGCSGLVASRDDLFDVVSSVALSSRNTTVWAQLAPLLVQTFSNGAQEFELFTVLGRRHRGLAITRPSDAQTWWPGFAWSVLQCPRCSRHIGWHFTPTNHSRSPFEFAALDVDAIDVLDDLLQVHL